MQKIMKTQQAPSTIPTTNVLGKQTSMYNLDMAHGNCSNTPEEKFQIQ